jgi:hypothetical protein
MIDPPEFQVTCESPRGLGVYIIDPPEFYTPHVLGVYRMDPLGFYAPRRLQDGFIRISSAKQSRSTQYTKPSPASKTKARTIIGYVVQDRVYRFAMLALDQLTHVGKDQRTRYYSTTGKEVIGDECYYLASKFQVTCESPHTPRALDVYKMNLPEYQVTCDSPRGLGF